MVSSHPDDGQPERAGDGVDTLNAQAHDTPDIGLAALRT